MKNSLMAGVIFFSLPGYGMQASDKAERMAQFRYDLQRGFIKPTCADLLAAAHSPEKAELLIKDGAYNHCKKQASYDEKKQEIKQALYRSGVFRNFEPDVDEEMAKPF